jgi:DNA-binding HxlR family transcriptional regulator
MVETDAMRSSEFPSQICSVARSLEIVGEWWTLLVVREAFFGTRRFSDFEANLSIAKNVLSDRLAKLVEAGVMERKPIVGRGNPQDYTLTPMGRDLFPAIIALMQWGDRWIYGAERAPVRVLDHEGGAEIARMKSRRRRESRCSRRTWSSCQAPAPMKRSGDVSARRR